MADTSFIDDLVEENEETQETPEEADKVEQVVETALSKREKGFYSEMRAERQKRQEIQSQLDKLSGTVKAVLEQRNTASQIVDDVNKKKFAGIPVAETADGDLYIPEDHLAKLVEPFQKKIEHLEGFLQQTTQSRNVESEAQKVISAIVGEDESFAPAYNKYTAARKYVEDKVVEFQRDNNMRGKLTPGQALDYVFDESAEAEFAAKFPGLPLEEIVTAEDSQRNFRKMLRTVAKVTAESRETPAPVGSRLKKLLNKPSGLGQTPNAKAGHLNVSEKMASLTPQDIYSLSDAQIKALEAALAQEEKEGGIGY